MKKHFLFTVSLFMCLVSYAKTDKTQGDRKVSNVQTTKLSCVIEDSRTGDIKNEDLYWEGTNLYAPVFRGDLAAGTGGVRPSSNVGEDRVFSRTVSGDTITVSLSMFGGVGSLSQFKYTEKLQASGKSSVQLRNGYCTSYRLE